MGDKPTVLILGGCGFVGRHLVAFLLENDLASKIRVADKSPTQTVYLNSKHKQAFEDARVHTMQANLANKAHVDRAFQSEGFKPDYVINLAAETRYGQGEEVYHEQVFTLSMNCATKSAEIGVRRYLELSSAQVYSGDKKASDETSKTKKPWTSLSKCKLDVEQGISNIENLDYAILRPATIYGIGDKLGLTPRLIIGAVYKQLNETMKLLWSSDLQMSTVHVEDVVRAIWHVCLNAKRGDVFNLADKNKSSQGNISALIQRIFCIKYGFFGSLISNMARTNMQGVVDDVNEKHLKPWSAACSADGIINTPLSPYLDKELLYNNHMNIDGSKIEKTGFTYKHKMVTIESLCDVVSDYIALGLFPPSLGPSTSSALGAELGETDCSNDGDEFLQEADQS